MTRSGCRLWALRSPPERSLPHAPSAPPPTQPPWAPPPRRQRHRALPRVGAAVIALALALAYATVLDGDSVWDDVGLVEQNRSLT